MCILSHLSIIKFLPKSWTVQYHCRIWHNELTILIIVWAVRDNKRLAVHNRMFKFLTSNRLYERIWFIILFTAIWDPNRLSTTFFNFSILYWQRTERFVLFIASHIIVQNHFRVYHWLWSTAFTIVLLPSTSTQIRRLITLVDFIDFINIISWLILILFELFIWLVKFYSFEWLSNWHVFIWGMYCYFYLFILLISWLLLSLINVASILLW